MIMIDSSCFPLIKSIPILSIAILNHAHRKKWQAKDIILTSQEKITSLFYIISGSIRLNVDSVTGNSRTLLQAESGNFIGEAHFFYTPYINANIEALTDVELAIFSKEKVFYLLETNNEFRIALLTGLSIKVLSYGNEMAENSYANDPIRLYHLLQELAKNNIVYATQTELAMMCGVHRVTINRWCQILKNF